MPDLVSLRYPTKGARQALELQAARLPWGWGRVMDNAGPIYVEELEKRTPIGQGQTPGKLRRGWRIRRARPGALSSVTVYNVEGHLVYVIKGRPAIDNTAKGYPLHFWIAGTEFYRWKVGPAAANPFHLNAIRAARGRLRQLLPREAAAALRSTRTM
jgi:hypothetical protein